MFIEVKTDQGKLVVINLMQLDVVTTDDDGLTILFTTDGTAIPYRTKEPYENVLARLVTVMGHTMPDGWRAPA